MNRNSIGIVIVLAVVIAGGWYLLPAGAPEAEPATNQMPVVGGTAPEMTVEENAPGSTVVYTDQGFSPENVTISKGQTVTWVNQSSKDMWVASAAHPTHMVYDGTSLSQHCQDAASAPFDACSAAAPGGSFSFTFDKEGVWKYHDHVNAAQKGSVSVTP